jgi:hypothetical protein
VIKLWCSFPSLLLPFSHFFSFFISPFSYFFLVFDSLFSFFGLIFSHHSFYPFFFPLLFMFFYSCDFISSLSNILEVKGLIVVVCDLIRTSRIWRLLSPSQCHSRLTCKMEQRNRMNIRLWSLYGMLIQHNSNPRTRLHDNKLNDPKH